MDHIVEIEKAILSQSELNGDESGMFFDEDLLRRYLRGLISLTDLVKIKEIVGFKLF